MEIYETAFVVSTYRSLHENLSKDPYARLWNNEKTDAIVADVSRSISPHESLLHSLRNRFFYEHLQSFFQTYERGTLINFGCGFSMYQFSLPETATTIEIDKKEIIDYKKKKIDQWTKTGLLPQRHIEYVDIDFNIRTEKEIIKTLQPLLKKQPTFIIIEGVLFFLDQKTTGKLFNVFEKIQHSGDLVGAVSYLPEVEHTEVYKRLIHYFDSNNNTNDAFSHQMIPHEYFSNMDQYHLKEHIDVFDLSNKYGVMTTVTSKEEILNEVMYLLERT